MHHGKESHLGALTCLLNCLLRICLSSFIQLSCVHDVFLKTVLCVHISLILCFVKFLCCSFASLCVFILLEAMTFMRKWRMCYWMQKLQQKSLVGKSWNWQAKSTNLMSSQVQKCSSPTLIFWLYTFYSFWINAWMCCSRKQAYNAAQKGLNDLNHVLLWKDYFLFIHAKFLKGIRNTW